MESIPPSPPIIDASIAGHPLDDWPAGPAPEGGGATCTFAGTTRPQTHPDFGELEALEYESAGPLADSMLHRLATDVATRHGLLGLRVAHAIGPVPVGEPSVRIEAFAAHRGPAFEGCREMIDRLKREVPIWKREKWRNGSTWSPNAAVLSSAELDPASRHRESES